MATIFADNILKPISLEINSILSQITLMCVPKGKTKNKLSMVQIKAWRRIGDKPLSEQMMA